MQENQDHMTRKNHFAASCDEVEGITTRERSGWLKARRLGIGGSDVATILGVNPYASPLSLWVEKTATEEPDDSSAEVALWGSLFEPAIVKEYSARSGRRCVYGGRLLRSKNAPHHQVTLDAVQTRKPPPWAKGPGVGECKMTGFAERYEEDLPPEVQVQIQWELYVTGAQWGTCFWLPVPERKLQWVDVAPHPAFQEVMIERVDAFWRLVKTGVPPQPDGSEASMLALRKMYPDHNDEVIRISGAKDICDEYERIGAAIKMLESRKSEIKNVLASTIREAQYAVLDDGRYWGTATYQPRKETCPHCAEVIRERGGYRTYTLRQPRKKAFPEPVAVRQLEMPQTDQLLEGQLRESLELVANDGKDVSYLSGEDFAADAKRANDAAADSKTGTES